jgi:coenzyme PQQ precursor peptide PqqA
MTIATAFNISPQMHLRPRTAEKARMVLDAHEQPNHELLRPNPWTRPDLVESCIGLEINDYFPAEL